MEAGCYVSISDPDAWLHDPKKLDCWCSQYFLNASFFFLLMANWCRVSQWKNWPWHWNYCLGSLQNESNEWNGVMIHWMCLVSLSAIEVIGNLPALLCNHFLSGWWPSIARQESWKTKMLESSHWHVTANLMLCFKTIYLIYYYYLKSFIYIVFSPAVLMSMAGLLSKLSPPPPPLVTKLAVQHKAWYRYHTVSQFQF